MKFDLIYENICKNIFNEESENIDKKRELLKSLDIKEDIDKLTDEEVKKLFDEKLNTSEINETYNFNDSEQDE